MNSLPEDYDIYEELAIHAKNKDAHAKHSYRLPNNNSEKARVLKELLAEIELEYQSIERQDIIQYKIKFIFVTQAMSILLALLMTINALIFLFSLNRLRIHEIVSMAMFLQAGILFVFAGVMIPRKTISKPRNFRHRKVDPLRKDLTFAFTHSLTYFLTALCMLVISVIFYNL